MEFELESEKVPCHEDFAFITRVSISISTNHNPVNLLPGGQWTLSSDPTKDDEDFYYMIMINTFV